MRTIQMYGDLITEKVDKIIDQTKPLDPDTIWWKPAEDAWSIMEILCHVEDFVNFWIRDIANVIHNSSDHFGRKLDDRNPAIENANNRTVEEVLQALENAKQNALKVLSNFNSTDLQVESLHINPKFGMKPMAFALDAFVIEHLDKHIVQIEKNLKLMQTS